MYLIVYSIVTHCQAIFRRDGGNSTPRSEARGMPSTRAQVEGLRVDTERRVLHRFKIRVWGRRMYQNVAFLHRRRQNREKFIDLFLSHEKGRVVICGQIQPQTSKSESLLKPYKITKESII